MSSPLLMLLVRWENRLRMVGVSRMPRIGRVSLRIWMMCTYVRESGESFIRCKGSEQSATSSLPGTRGVSIGIAVGVEYESPSLRRHLMRRLLDIATWLMAPITLLCRFQDEY